MGTVDMMFKALSDETRLRMVNLLLERELCVCEVMEVIGSTQSKTSRHLTYLKNTGLAKSRRNGLWIHYSLKRPGSGVHRMLLDAVKESRRDVSLLRRDLKKLEKVSERRAC
jgi:ArsR family transcriptional regulator